MRALFLILLLLTYSLSSYKTALANDAPTSPPESKPTDFSYKLIMSEDDSVCKPLTALYNEMLTDDVKKTRRPQKAYFATNYEAREPEKFENIGYTSPPKKDVMLPSPPHSFPSTYTETIFLADLFNEGKPRILSYSELSRGPVTLTRIAVLKKDVEYREIQTSPISVGVDPSIIDRDASYEGLVNSQKDKSDGSPQKDISYLGYLLKKWPHFDKLYAAYFEYDKKNGHLPMDWSLPAINESGTPTSARLFIHNDRPYFILNGYGYRTGGENNLLVYKVGADGFDDICYINLSGKASDARRKAILQSVN